ncbi:unnamed protein product [Linum trigynum]|uniref:Glucosamine-phosphate N-acetyltransferase n=1 Tax=Linum trigynum TaxID=586398 RepID=A0AAV2E826_9ROSI
MKAIGAVVSRWRVKRKEASNVRDQEEEVKGGDGLMGLGDVLQRLIPPDLMISPSNGQLVGFGRAVSDSGLTASIHDVVVKFNYKKDSS